MKTKMNLNDYALWEQIIYDLNGTCDSLENKLEQHNALELQDYIPFLNHVDNNIFCCTTCCWWYDISDMAENDDWECTNCAPSEE